MSFQTLGSVIYNCDADVLVLVSAFQVLLNAWCGAGFNTAVCTCERVIGENMPLPKSKILDEMKLAVLAMASVVALATSFADSMGYFMCDESL